MRAFEHFGAVPARILYDNIRIAVARILGGEERTRPKAFLELQSHCLFADEFGRPANGNDKAKVEGLSIMPAATSWFRFRASSVGEAFNAHLAEQCYKRRERRPRGHTEAIGERSERDHAAMVPLPEAPDEACQKVSTRVTLLSLVRYRGNDYSVPTRTGTARS